MALLSAAVAGCFQPMYGQSTLFGAGAKLRDELRQVEILEMPGRCGFTTPCWKSATT